MQDLVLIPVHDLRQIIREELAVNTAVVEQNKLAPTKPVGQQELCEFLNLSEPTIIRWRDKGKIPFMRIGSAVRYDLYAVIEAIEVGKKKRS